MLCPKCTEEMDENLFVAGGIVRKRYFECPRCFHSESYDVPEAAADDTYLQFRQIINREWPNWRAPK